MSFTYDVINVSLRRLINDMVSDILYCKMRKANLTTCKVSISYHKYKFKFIMGQKRLVHTPPINLQIFVKWINPSPINIGHPTIS